ncbi:MAG: hypothetical protein RIR00_615 [Pseudomonadota bacterium]|jgi:hypothetical protein
MSGFEDYHRELAELDHQIHHYAVACNIDLSDQIAVRHCLETPQPDFSHNLAQQTLRGLLILRIKLETEMISEGVNPPPLDTRPFHV